MRGFSPFVEFSQYICQSHWCDNVNLILFALQSHFCFHSLLVSQERKPCTHTQTHSTLLNILHLTEYSLVEFLCQTRSEVLLVHTFLRVVRHQQHREVTKYPGSSYWFNSKLLITWSLVYVLKCKALCTFQNVEVLTNAPLNVFINHVNHKWHIE